MYTDATTFQTGAQKKEGGAPIISVSYVLFNAVCVWVCISVSGTVMPHGSLGVRNSDSCSWPGTSHCPINQFHSPQAFKWCDSYERQLMYKGVLYTKSNCLKMKRFANGESAM